MQCEKLEQFWVSHFSKKEKNSHSRKQRRNFFPSWCSIERFMRVRPQHMVLKWLNTFIGKKYLENGNRGIDRDNRISVEWNIRHRMGENLLRDRLQHFSVQPNSLFLPHPHFEQFWSQIVWLRPIIRSMVILSKHHCYKPAVNHLPF